jgi:hypothetical protein
MRSLDPIVEEVRAVREALAKEFDYDLAKIVASLKAEQATSGRVLESRPARPVGVPRKAS